MAENEKISARPKMELRPSIGPERFDKAGQPLVENVDNSGLKYIDFRGNKATWKKPEVNLVEKK